MTAKIISYPDVWKSGRIISRPESATVVILPVVRVEAPPKSAQITCMAGAKSMRCMCPCCVGLREAKASAKCEEVERVSTKRRKFLVSLYLTPAAWARLERLAREADTNIPTAIAGIVTSEMEP